MTYLINGDQYDIIKIIILNKIMVFIELQTGSLLFTKNNRSCFLIFYFILFLKDIIIYNENNRI